MAGFRQRIAGAGPWPQMFPARNLERDLLKLYQDAALGDRLAVVKAVLFSKTLSREQPNNRDEVIARVCARLLKEKPVRLVGLWGGSKPPRHKADSVDAKALDFLKRTALDGLADEGIKAEVTLLFCDIHHNLVNGIDARDSKAYFDSLKPLAEEREIRLVSLEQVLDSVWGVKGGGVGLTANPFACEEMGQTLDSNPAAKEKLAEMAAKHAPGNPATSSAVYAFTERSFLELLSDPEIFISKMGRLVPWLKKEGVCEKLAEFENAVFFSYSNPLVQKPIAGKTPMLFFWSLGTGWSNAPWYLQEGQTVH